MIYQIGETVICSLQVKTLAGVLVDPATSMTISIGQKPGVVKVDDIAMTKDTTGEYHYDAQTVGWEQGTYIVTYKAVDGNRITIQPDDFLLE